jgi:hypothetical protein
MVLEALLHCYTPGYVRGAALTYPGVMVFYGEPSRVAAVRAAPLTLPGV